MSTTTTTRISAIHLVMVPSTDQDRSIAFYEALGFEKRADAPFGEGHRWVELYPPSGPTGIALAPASPSSAGVQTGIIITTDDIDATLAELRAGGVDVDDAVAREGAPTEIRLGDAAVVGPFPPMFYLRDPDGNALLAIGPAG
jgi:catechol 2,3-dioxygenase-like lactoylglutathione lyase family enzyme